MKIIHVITTIDRGGAENAVLLLTRLQQLNKHQVTIVPLKGVGELRTNFEQAGIACDFTLMNKSFISQYFLLRRRYDKTSLLHGHLPRAEILLALAKRGTKFFITRHNAESFYPGAPSLVSRILSKFVTKQASGVVAISQTVREYLVNTREVEASKISMIYYGYDAVNSHLAINFKENRNASELRLVCVSRLAPQKNLQFLLRLLRSLQDDKICASLDIYGSGSQLFELQKYAKSLNLAKVRFCGKTESVVKILENYDFFILTSRYEGFGLVLLEAMDAAIPIVAPRISAVPEVLGINHVGLFEHGNLVDCKAKLLELINSPSKTKSLVQYQKRRLSVFSSTKYLREHELLYGIPRLN